MMDAFATRVTDGETVGPSGPPGLPGVIPAARVELVPLAVGHAEEMAGVLGDPALYRFTGGEPEDVDALRARYARQSAGSPDPAVLWGNWVVRVRGDGRLVGTVQATVADGAAEVAWVIGTAWQGRGSRGRPRTRWWPG